MLVHIHKSIKVLAVACFVITVETQLFKLIGGKGVQQYARSNTVS